MHHLNGRSHLSPSQAVSRLAIAMILLGGSQLISVAETELHPGFEDSVTWMEAHHRAGEPLLVTHPVVAWLSVPEDDRDDLVFLAGAEENPRSSVYVLENDDGELTDYWVGIPVIAHADQLETYLRSHPNAWIVVDGEWLDINHRLGGQMAQVLAEMTTVVHAAPDGEAVLRVNPQE